MTLWSIDVQVGWAYRAAQNPTRVWLGPNPAWHEAKRARADPARSPGRHNPFFHFFSSYKYMQYI